MTVLNEQDQMIEDLNVGRSIGKIQYADDVILQIAAIAALDVKGIIGMSGGIFEGITEKVGKKNYSKGIKVEVGSEEVAIDFKVIVEYGRSIPQIFENLKKNVHESISFMTGLKVVEINMTVEGVQIKENKEVEEKNVEPVERVRIK